MALVATELSPASRNRAIGVFLRQSIVGLLLLIWVTATRSDEPARVFHALGSQAPILVAILVAFAFALSILKFPLTGQIFVSLLVTAFFASFPLLGVVMTSWLAVIAAITARVLAAAHIGPLKTDMSDRRLEYARIAGLLGTYGIPTVLATMLYVILGGEVPLLHPSMSAVARIAAAALLFMIANSIVTGRVEYAFGYPIRTSVRSEERRVGKECRSRWSP